MRKLLASLREHLDIHDLALLDDLVLGVEQLAAYCLDPHTALRELNQRLVPEQPTPGGRRGYDQRAA